MKPKVAEVAVETVKLKPVLFVPLTDNFTGQQNELAAAREQMLENAAVTGRSVELTKRLVAADGKRAEAAELFDNLTLAVQMLREDLEGIKFRFFKQEHFKDKSGEEYLNELMQLIPEELRANNSIINGAGLRQLEAAQALLLKAKDALNESRREYEIICQDLNLG